ncbi:tRNA (N(6)-L-threonylcarbamoyladenosine(37)-C(2))-methylthiotransferase [archaeon]|jgi:threonylcarbamoyladenosine tRNA methylthiotransferase CDKAL1|nr:tRNA (N(6)-L-threonylcarbamoyladenosine(37)-C(2))-methylthiotransferase [archaeon]MBT3450543.1 tRNA (N(6)-L-threonylcarbamoyladenosine(37)-C(2))-methylthiotransferase [archaeon]MBT6868515.1 tRNA (N(6)-L-threonylcarbamoyladenosine(37)-C(2))-methylthiotransferase [archaeon]MBT7193049.1 tRNA (N(6)-L-threonylcarbamoyladenosine(37)-C(2))-methylthiotransferase [archaeon]MBT7381138.1 tRNA (N(6)-L-threonylcarbamoyladenosine(37)-C(2))-methylthiotransferase [archaeon]
MVKIFIETYGCSANFADSEQMAGLLKEAKFQMVNNIDDSDLVIINTCTVKGPTEDKFWYRLKELNSMNKMIVIAGCIAQTERKKLKKYSLIGTKKINKIVEIVEEVVNDNVVKEVSFEENPPLNLPIVRKNPIVEIVPISRGCLGKCTFCKTKAARGSLESYSIEEIVERVGTAVSEGVKEIWLTSQDCGCYGFDINTSLVELLENIVQIKGKYKIRIGMMNPDHLAKILEPLVEIYQNKKIFKFLHLPVQSGDDKILESMGRPYKSEDFVHQVNTFRRSIPEITIATDIIIGFPGETDEQHWNTMSLIRNISPDAVNISKFWPRPNTLAAKMKSKVPVETVKHRSKVLMDIFKNIAKLQNERWLEWEGPIIIDEKGKEDREWVGRNEAYKQVIVRGHYKIGDLIKVKINKAETFALIGKEIRER